MYGLPCNDSQTDEKCLVDSKWGCPQLPGTLLRVNIPAGAVINLANLVEITSPSGICLIIRIPLLGGSPHFQSLMDSIKRAGGSIEVIKK